jgi:hypothetical protein
MKKILILLTGLILSMFMFQTLALAQGTILPQQSPDNDCDDLINFFNENSESGYKNTNLNQVLGCAVVTGRVSLPMVPYFIRYFSNFLLGIVSLVSLLFVVIGGFMYTMGGMTGKKDQGKAYITNALIGMIIAFLAWTVVNVIISAITG